GGAGIAPYFAHIPTSRPPRRRLRWISTSTTTEGPCRNQTTIRRENRRSWRERHASRKSSNVGHPARALPARTLRLARWKGKDPRRRARQVPGAEHEARPRQPRRHAPGAHRPIAARPGSRAGVASGVPRPPTASPRVEIREHDLEHTCIAIPPAASTRP